VAFVSLFKVKNAGDKIAGGTNLGGLNHSRGWHRGLQAELLGFERHGDRTGTRYINFAVAAHNFNEFVELLGIARGFDGEAFRRGIDNS
jgi:hypothetical protein